MSNLEESPQKTEAIIVDIDGTISHKYDRGIFEYEKAADDRPDEKVLEVIRCLHATGYQIVIVTGRNTDCIDITKEWLKQNCPPYAELFMRGSKDFRHDADIKREIYLNQIQPHYNILCVFDDRDRVVNMWRELGLKCLQVEPGNF